MSEQLELASFPDLGKLIALAREIVSTAQKIQPVIDAGLLAVGQGEYVPLVNTFVAAIAEAETFLPKG